MSIPVSLVITTYNRERYLGAAIASVLAQTYPHFELVVWDDGSTDNSLAIARGYAERDRRVRVVAAPHQGRMLALKMALACTEGTYLGWVDSDDLLAPTALAETVEVLATQPTTGWVYTDYVDIDAGGKPLNYGFRCQMPYSPERLLVDFMTFHFRLMRRSAFEQVGGIDLAIQDCEDYDISLRLSEQFPVVHLAKPLYYYRHHDQSQSSQGSQRQIHWSQVAIQRALDRRRLSDRLQISLEGDRFVLRSRKPKLAPWRACIPNCLPRPVGAMLAGLSLLGLGAREAQALVAPTPGQLKQGTVTTQPRAVPQPSSPAARTTIPDLPEPQPRFAETSPLALQLAQSIQSASDGTGTVVNQAGDQFDITGGQQSGDQTNLFHSFEQFNLSAEQTATFLSQPEIQNIVGRIVGGDPSRLNGLLQVVGGTSNLFLVNPAGLLVGPNMQLDIPGSLTLTSANAIGFGDQWLNTIGSADYSLLNGAPTGFTFLADSPSPVVNTGNLTVNPGQAVRLMGGTVVNTGTITAPGGEIILSAVPGSSTVRISQPGQLLSLEIEAAVLQGGSLPVTSLPELLTGVFATPGLTVNDMNQAVLSARNVVIPEGQVAAVSGQLDVSNPDGMGGTVAVLGDRVGLFDATLNASGETGGGQMFIGGGYQGQGPVPNASRTVVDGDTTLAANALITGDGGQIFVWADGATSFLGDLEIRGGAEAGNGGFAEVSGREFLDYRGRVDAQAAHGMLGTLLLDPTNIEIVGSGYGATDELAQVRFENIPDLDEDNQRTQLLASAINGAFANVQLEATNNITFNADVVMEGFGYNLSATAGNRIDVNADITLSGGNFVANSAVFNSAGSTLSNSFGDIQITTTGGDITLGAIDGNDTNVVLQSANNITFDGVVNLFGSGYDLSVNAGNRIDVNSDIRLEGGNFVANSAVFNAVDGTLRNLFGGIQITTTGGDITLGAIDGNDTNVVLQSANNITFDGEVNLFVSELSATTGNRIDVNQGIRLNGGDFVANSTVFDASGVTITTLGGDIRITTTGGNITTSNLDTSIVAAGSGYGSFSSRSGGSIFLNSADSISTENLRTFSQNTVTGSESSTTANSGSGGDVTLLANGSAAISGDVQTYSRSTITGFNVTANSGSGGNITILANGPVVVGGNISSSSLATATDDQGTSSASAIANASDAGAITILSRNMLSIAGAVDTTSIATATNENGRFARAIAGQGGNISLTASSVAVGNLNGFSQATAEFNNESGFEEAAIATADQGSEITIVSSGSLSAGDINVASAAAAIAPLTPNVVSAAAASGGTLALTANGNLQVGGIDNQSTGESGGNIALTSQTGTVSAGDLTTSGPTQGGNVTVSAFQSITAGQITTRSSQGNGGNVTLDPEGDIEVSFIDAQGGSQGNGGTVDITTDRFFRATGTFIDQNETVASISTAGGEGGGPITIRHGGGRLGTPFTVGAAVSGPNDNGTAAAITTGSDNTITSGSFPETYVQGEDPSIQIITQPRPEPPENNDEDLLIQIQGEQPSTVPITEELQPQTKAPIKDLGEAREILRQVENATGIKPALVYVQFIPARLEAETSEAASTEVETIDADLSSHFVQRETLHTQQFEAHLTLPNALTSAPVVGQADTDQLELMVITADGSPIWKRVNVSRAEMLATAQRFRLEVADSRKVWTRSYADSGQQLYQWVIDPIQPELDALGIGNLTFVADAGLRSLPWAALYDGQQFLIEAYSVGLMPSLSLADTQFRDIRNVQILAGGASKFEAQADLPAVPIELDLIETLWPGTVLPEAEFTPDRLRQQRQRTPYGIVHLATHGEFQPGRPENSFIQLGDQRLGLDELRTMGWSNPPLELLVLSACRTALGDEEAELGFAGLALQAGVKSALASLWYVSDVGTLALMTEFYRQLQTAPEATLKAEALRRSQLQLLRGEVKIQDDSLYLPGQAKGIALGPDLSGTDTVNLSHPFYWAAFTMSGNPW